MPAIGAHHLPLTDLVRDALRDAIHAGQFRPGERLVEGKLAARFGVSRNPVREALKALANEGIVTIMPRRGAVVAELSATEAQEVIELRAAVEGIGARLAARRIGPDSRGALMALLALGTEKAREGDVETMTRLIGLVNEELARAGHNRYLAEVLRTLRTRTQWLFEGPGEERALQSWDEQAAILRAVLDGDEDEAARLASRHAAGVGLRLRRSRDGMRSGPSRS